ncbi:hypothetical protein IM40_02790 [Candidatus Paracaedimonas acanthamoebae]|nr:hypothetical protein IM40_02790 [Candidatus Paracaedimonas acanthamoebae]
MSPFVSLQSFLDPRLRGDDRRKGTSPAHLLLSYISPLTHDEDFLVPFSISWLHEIPAQAQGGNDDGETAYPIIFLSSILSCERFRT